MKAFKEWLTDERLQQMFGMTKFIGKKVLLQPFIEDHSSNPGLDNLLSASGKPLGKEMYELHNYWKVVGIGNVTTHGLSLGDIVSIDDNMLIPPMIDSKHPVGNNPDNPQRIMYGNPLDRLFPFRFQDDKFQTILDPGTRTEEMLHYLPEDLITTIWSKEQLLEILENIY